MDDSRAASQCYAKKQDEGKPDISMVSRELVEGLALVRMFGAKKYTRIGS